jgi:hypothetical protein
MFIFVSPQGFDKLSPYGHLENPNPELVERLVALAQ